MRVIVCGGRHWGEAFGPGASERPSWRREVRAVREALEELRPSVVVQGGARGAARVAREWAETWHVPCETFAAAWGRLGHAAVPERNARMVAAGADIVLALPGGAGTADCIRRAVSAGIPVLRKP